MRFTKRNYKHLQILQAGNITSIDKTDIFKQVTKSRLEFLVRKSENIPNEHLRALGLKMFQSSFDSRDDAALYLIDNFDANYTAFVDNIITCDEEISYTSSDDDSYISSDEEEVFLIHTYSEDKYIFLLLK